MAEIITVDGQVTIPAAVRDRLGIAAGSFVEFEVTAHGDVVLTKAPEASLPHGKFERFIGIAGPGPTTDEMMLMLRGEIENLPE